jgi:hypothetical protein
MEIILIDFYKKQGFPNDCQIIFEMTDDFQWDFQFFVKNCGNPSKIFGDSWIFSKFPAPPHRIEQTFKSL